LNRLPHLTAVQPLQKIPKVESSADFQPLNYQSIFNF